MPVTAWPNYLWRLLATGWSFVHLFVGALFLVIFVFPLLYLVPGTKQQKVARARKTVQLCFRQFIWEMCFLGVISLEQKELERLNQLKGAVLIANHPTLIDVVLIMALLENVNCIVKSSLWQSPFLGGVMRAAAYISNANDPEQLLDDCAQVLSRGENIIIFPEGTRTVDDSQLKFQRGTAHIILHAKAKVQPILINCEPPTLKKGDPWYKIPARKPHFTLQVLPAIEPEHQLDAKLMPSQASRQLTQLLQNYFQQALSS